MWFMEFLDKFFLFLSSKQYKRTVLKLKYLNILVARINEFHKLKFIYPGKVKFFCKISTVDFSLPIKSTVEISQNFVAFAEYMNFTCMYSWTPILDKKREHSKLNSFKCISDANFMIRLRAILIVQKRRWYHHMKHHLVDQIYF